LRYELAAYGGGGGGGGGGGEIINTQREGKLRGPATVTGGRSNKSKEWCREGLNVFLTFPKKTRADLPRLDKGEGVCLTAVLGEKAVVSSSLLTIREDI